LAACKFILPGRPLQAKQEMSYNNLRKKSAADEKEMGR